MINLLTNTNYTASTIEQALIFHKMNRIGGFFLKKIKIKNKVESCS
jgi:hypothetical protein